MRVVSLIPLATEILGLLGASSSLVGRSHQCDHPPEAAHTPILTDQRTAYTSPSDVDRQVSRSVSLGQSLYHLDSDRLRTLAPDLVITQALCEVCSIDLDTVRSAVRELDPEPVLLTLHPESMEDLYDDIMRIGAALGCESRAQHEVVRLRERFHEAADYVNPYTEPVNTLFLEWTDPPFVGGHWTVQLLERAGASHPLNPTAPLPGAGSGAGAQGAHRIAGKSVRVTPDEIVDAAPQAIIICPCGVPLDRVHDEADALAELDWFRSLPAFDAGRIALVDGNQMFNRPGPRLVDAFRWLVGWLNDVEHLMPEEFPWSPYESR